jgi:hypothetical protein
MWYADGAGSGSDRYSTDLLNRMDPICAWITVCMTCGFQVLYNLWAGERDLNRFECTTKARHGGFKCRQEERKLALTVRHSNNKPTTEGVNVNYTESCGLM